MATFVIWSISAGAGLGLLLVTAALGKIAFHAFLCALFSMNFCIMVLREHDRPVGRPDELLGLMAVNARYLGLIWLWMSLAILMMHVPKGAFGAITGYAVGGLAASVLCLCSASLIQGFAAKHPERVPELLRITGFLDFVHVVGALVTGSVLAAEAWGSDPRLDWASLNIVAFSSAALAVVAARGLVALMPDTSVMAGSVAVRAAAGVPWRAPAR